MAVNVNPETETLALWVGPRMVLERGSDPFMAKMPASALGMPADELYADPLLVGLVHEMRDTYETGRDRVLPWGREVIYLTPVLRDGIVEAVAMLRQSQPRP